MSSDEEIDDVQRFYNDREQKLADKANLNSASYVEQELSDEEVMGIQSDNESDEDSIGWEYDQGDKQIEQKRAQANKERDLHWGKDRENYFGGEDDVGEDDGASEEEEAEALRLQEQELESMDENDFVDEDDMETWQQNADKLDVNLEEIEESHINELSSSLLDAANLSSEERRNLVTEKFPAVLLLSNELKKLSTQSEELDTIENEKLRSAGKTAIEMYKGCCYAYYALFNEFLRTKDIQGLAKLEEHPVNEALLTARQFYLNFNDLKNKLSQADENSLSINGSIEEDETHQDEQIQNSASELEEFSEVAQSDSESSQDDSDDEFAIKKDISNTSTAKVHTVNDFDEAADTIEQQARMKNKQSLRFYASQVGRSKAAAPQISGDADLPYQERDFERRQRLLAEAQKRGQEAPDTLGDEDDFEGLGEIDDDVYHEGNSLYATESLNKRISKDENRILHEQAALAAKEGRLEEYISENANNSNKRAINYQIEKNKGLTRKRKKENRNARVKKRHRYEDAQKRIKGVRKVYKGSEGPYQGETTGIRKNLAHSTRFKS